MGSVSLGWGYPDDLARIYWGGHLKTLELQNDHAFSRASGPKHDRLGLLSRTLLAAGLGAGMVGAGLLSAWVFLLSREGGQFVLRSADWNVGTLPALLVWAAASALVVGLVCGLALLMADMRVREALVWSVVWLRSHPWWALMLLAGMLLGAVDWSEIFFLYDQAWGGGPLSSRLWLLREDLRGWLLLAAAVMGGLGLASLGRSQNWRLGEVLARRRAWAWMLAGAMPIILGAAMSLLALEGIPHFSDSLTYLMQGRILMSGRLGVDMPANPNLFLHSLFFITQRIDEAGQVVTSPIFYGKYPIGWPLILGMFDHVGLGFLANGLLAGMTAVVTGLAAAQFTTRRVAVLSALVLGLSPWAWFHASTFASHVASTLAIMCFLWLTLRTLRLTGAHGSRSPSSGNQLAPGLGHGSFQASWSALGAGLALGYAVLVRPFDAAMFALPVAVLVLVMQWRQPRRWLGLGTLMALGALAGVGVYAWVNHETVGQWLHSPYQFETRWGSDWNWSLGSLGARLAFQWAELNAQFPGWGLGGLVMALAGLMVTLRRRRGPALAVMAAGTILFFVGSATFGFTNVWWGSRWLLPAAPLLAILAAEFIDTMLEAAGSSRPSAAAAQVGLCIVAAGLIAGLAFRYGGQFWQNRIMPPHAVSSEAYRFVQAQGLHDAVVAMPTNGRRAPFDARAGMAYMQVPFEANAVIFVRDIPGVVEAVRQTFPTRSLYRYELQGKRSVWTPMIIGQPQGPQPQGMGSH